MNIKQSKMNNINFIWKSIRTSKNASRKY